MIARPTSINRLRKVVADVWRPRDRTTVTDWCRDNVRLSRVWEATSGPFNVKDNPFLIDILDAFLDPKVYEISLLKSTQVGGTFSLICALLAMSELDPAPSMVVSPDKVSAIEFRDRLYDNATASPMIRHKVPAKSNWNDRAIDLKSCRSYLAWAGSPQRLRGRACKRVYRTEIDVYPRHELKGGNVLKASEQRVKRFHWSQIYNESTPDGENSLIAGLYDKSDMRKWWCPCPHCDHWQILRFFPHRQGPYEGCGGVKGYANEHGELLSLDEARRRVYYCCEKGCRLDTRQKNQMVSRGMWLPAGQSVVNGKVVGKRERSKRHSGFHLWSLHSPIVTLPKIITAYLEARIDNTLKEFFQDWLGRRFSATQKVPEWHKLGRKLVLQGHHRGTTPKQSWFLTAGSDVQQNGIYYVVRAWGHAGTSWLVDYGFLARYQGANFTEEETDDDEVESVITDLEQVKPQILDRWFPVVDPPNQMGSTRARVLLAGIDANYRTRDVHNYIVSLSDPKRRLRAVRGDHNVKPSQRFRETVVEKPTRGGQPYKDGGLRLTGVSSVSYKEDFLERWRLIHGADGFSYLPGDFMNYGEQYLKQVTNSAPVIKTKPNGMKVKEFIIKRPALGVHLLDCEVYAFAAAEIILAERDVNWDSSKWVKSSPAPETPQQPLVHNSEPSVMARDYM